jgi:hypothetical protein
MKIKMFISMISFVAVTLAGDTFHAVDGTINLSDGHQRYFPEPSFSFSWVTKKACHDLSAEFFTGQKEVDEYGDTRQTVAFGLTYSYLKKTPIEYLFAGPSAGFVVCLSKTSVHAYFCGVKIAGIMGKSSIRLRIQDRLLLGKEGAVLGLEDFKLALLNTFGMGVMFVF